MSINVFKKPGEKFPISIDYANTLPPGATVVSATLSATDDAGANATATILPDTSAMINGSRVIFYMQSGNNNSKYYVSVQTTFSDTSVLIEDVVLKVQSKY